MSASATTSATNTKRIALVASVLGSAIVFVDSTIVNVALPSIRASLHGTLADQQWVVEAYLLTLASLLLVGGSLGDLLGRRRMFSFGLAGFGICSILCAIAPNSTVLILARGAQGMAGALLVPSTLALIMDVFPQNERAGAIGTWTAWAGIGTVLGPFGGGALVQLASWRWIFAINLVPVAVTLELLRRLEPDKPTHGHVDWVGAVLCAFGLGGPVFGLIEQPNHGWGDPRVAIPILVGVALLVAFVVWERRCSEPMLPLYLFRVRNFAVGNITTLMVYGGLGVATFFVVLFIQQVAGYTPIQAGLSLLPITLLMFTLSRRFGMLADRLGSRWFMSGGPAVAGLGLLLLTRTNASASYWTTIFPGVFVFGLGLSATVAPLTATVLGSVGAGRSGLASGVNNAVARVASLLAIAALGAVVAGSFATKLDELAGHTSTPAALTTAKERPLVVTTAGVPRSDLVDASVYAFRVGLGIGAGLVILGGLISLVGIRNPRSEVQCAECPGGALVPANAPAALRSPEAGTATGTAAPGTDRPRAPVAR